MTRPVEYQSGPPLLPTNGGAQDDAVDSRAMWKGGDPVRDLVKSASDKSLPGVVSDFSIQSRKFVRVADSSWLSTPETVPEYLMIRDLGFPGRISVQRPCIATNAPRTAARALIMQPAPYLGPKHDMAGRMPTRGQATHDPSHDKLPASACVVRRRSGEGSVTALGPAYSLNRLSVQNPSVEPLTRLHQGSGDPQDVLGSNLAVSEDWTQLVVTFNGLSFSMMLPTRAPTHFAYRRNGAESPRELLVTYHLLPGVGADNSAENTTIIADGAALQPVNGGDQDDAVYHSMVLVQWVSAHALTIRAADPAAFFDIIETPPKPSMVPHIVRLPYTYSCEQSQIEGWRCIRGALVADAAEFEGLAPAVPRLRYLHLEVGVDGLEFGNLLDRSVGRAMEHRSAFNLAFRSITREYVTCRQPQTALQSSNDLFSNSMCGDLLDCKPAVHRARRARLIMIAIIMIAIHLEKVDGTRLIAGLWSPQVPQTTSIMDQLPTLQKTAYCLRKAISFCERALIDTINKNLTEAEVSDERLRYQRL
ncbi:hypothetical protein BDK51DRAFT_44860 [Blyttiomyces helicus]|uniref:Uncharacterized protein n=1 Tax=Blyttiomyces helicus TaxID=388810 RepID=A0A4V1ISG0_9FUNG|nr:hypothetical protein BDK51DRAFT_44860 [Blyttiomyces helicus]|eukprot:RKO93427.1 hypothetical protein BDK51DRAFT_44860 [Blyttiomyces helicus]